ncbi:uncharacterized protein LTR77_010807 [Saxophila tyrrhenica]|uniref:Wax synthase domain-containing protein n=1 Tax=Saxophila tyrrhenica TaxID=1690608 RepID=A0AAV9NUM9_9PEZI|nr:hypothetical protein LTR77_010807 [Saxophila tyrrhenica]
MNNLKDLPSKAMDFMFSNEPRPGLHPIPGTEPIRIEALILPPLMYYVALLFLPPAPPQAVDTVAFKTLRNGLAILAGILFFRLPLAYHIPQSIGLNYQLSLVGIYGGCRVIDVFFIGPYLFNHIPRRVRYEHRPRVETPAAIDKKEDPMDKFSQPTTSKKRVGFADSSPTPSFWDRRPSLALDDYMPASAADAANTAMGHLTTAMNGPRMQPVYEVGTPEDGWPHTFHDRASWALELELSMRGMGFTWTTADVRHTNKTWLPTVHNRLHSIATHVVPVMLLCLFTIRDIYTTHVLPSASAPFDSASAFDERLSLPNQLLLTATLGAFLMVAFSLAHSLFAIVCAPLSPSPFAFFPPLYTTRIWSITSVRGFWSYGWHRLFARLFLVYGVWPGQWLERKLLGKRGDEPADVGKVVGGFLSSAVVHSFSVRSVLAGEWGRAKGEAVFFASNGAAVVVEEVVARAVVELRRRLGVKEGQWYDGVVGRVWWIAVLLFSGRNFARGWVDAGLVREMAGY